MNQQSELLAPVICDIDGATATITLNRPERLNAINRDLADRLVDQLERVAREASVRVVILRGAGKAFCAGGDLRDLAEGTMFPVDSSHAEKVLLLRRQMRSTELLAEMPKLTIAAIHGACVGAGFSLAAACDVRFCASSAVFRTGFLPAGLSGDYGGTWALTRALGSARARELFFLSPSLSAPDAERIGLVTQVVDDGALLETVRTKAETLAAIPPDAALTRMKANLNLALTAELARVLDCEAENQIRCLEGETVKQAAAILLRARKRAQE